MRRQRQMCSTDDSQRLAKQRRFAPEPAPRWEHPMCRHRLLRLRVAVVVVPTTSIFAFEPTIVLVCEARDLRLIRAGFMRRSGEHTSELQSLMRISYAVFCLKKKNIIERKKTKMTCRSV